MKNIASKIVFTLIALAIGIWIVSNIISSQHSKAEEEKEEVEKKIQIEQTISNMVARHNAVTDWNKNFYEGDTLLRHTYTVQVEDALIRNDGRPVLLFGSVDDVIRQGNKYYVHFQNVLYQGPDIHFVLECDSEQVKKIMGHMAGLFNQYAVVALIQSLQRPKFEVTAFSHSGEDAEVVVESSDIFIARGRCLDLLFVGDYYFYLSSSG